MNERIRELMVQAIHAVDGIDNPETHRMYIPDVFAEKFVELIVEDCMDVVIKSDTSPKTILHEPYRTIVNNITEHFWS